VLPPAKTYVALLCRFATNVKLSVPVAAIGFVVPVFTWVPAGRTPYPQKESPAPPTKPTRAFWLKPQFANKFTHTKYVPVATGVNTDPDIDKVMSGLLGVITLTAPIGSMGVLGVEVKYCTKVPSG